jgi:hypothetical protein
MYHTNARLSIITKVGTSLILNKLRYTEKLSISFLPSTDTSTRLGD